MLPGLLVTDLDGTLLDRRGRVSERNRAALSAARAAGWHVAIATGRTWAESHRATDCVAEDALFIGAGGASLHWAGSGEVIATETVDARLAVEIAHAIVDAGHRAHLLLDASRAGHDYVFLGTAELDPATRWWLSEHPVTSRDWVVAPEGAHDELAGCVLRVGTIGASDEIAPVARGIEARFGGSLAVRHWSALTAEEAVGSRTHMLEVFSPRADKWSMACAAANRLGVARDRIVALGDGLNDLELIRNAPMGVAMANADARILGIAAARTASHDADGVAVAVEALLDGRLVRGWDGSSAGAGHPRGTTA
jgi:hydroxymethylpyrimidine pyrophosphatase-like HAD family hydrolase